MTNTTVISRIPTLLDRLKKEYNTQLICITPFRDERWILDRFLSCALMWADHIILGDNNSIEPYDDILERHDLKKITVIKNDMKVFNESALRQPLLEKAREFSGRKILVFLDADEVISGNFLDSTELQTLFSAPEGTVFTANIFQLGEFLRDGFIAHQIIPFFTDDGKSEYNMSKQFHGYRIPGESNEIKWNIIKLNDISILHYSRIDSGRVKIKWYQVQEFLQPNGKTVTQILRQYTSNRLGKPGIHPLEQIADSSYRNYLNIGIDMTSISKPYFVWQEKVVVDLINEYGSERFDLLDIWDYDWAKASLKYYNQKRSSSHKRSITGRLLRTYIRKTEEISRNRIIILLDRIIDNLLSFIKK